jgi:hypothetical protein
MLHAPLRMPGAFAEPSLEAAWLADVAAHRCVHDATCYAFSATIHLVELVRMTPPALLLRVTQLAYVRPPPHLRCAALLRRSAHARRLRAAAGIGG